MKHLMLFLSLFLLMSCGDKDSDFENSIVGTWELIKFDSELEISEDSIISEGEGKDFNASITFLSKDNEVIPEGSFVLVQSVYFNGVKLSSNEITVDFSKEFSKGRWDLSGKTLILSTSNSQVPLTVLSLNNKKLVFQLREDGVKNTYVFKR